MEKVGLPKPDTRNMFKLIMKNLDVCGYIYWNDVCAPSCNPARWAKDVEYVADGETESLQTYAQDVFHLFEEGVTTIRTPNTGLKRVS
jgi:hypothetical protein